MTSATDIVMRAQDVLSVRRVFGEPVERDGIVVIPVARVVGGGGAGVDEGEAGANGRPGRGSGGGYGLRAVPAGVVVIRSGTVSWRPAIDANRIALGGQLLAAVVVIGAFLTLRRLMTLRAGRAGAAPALPPSGEPPAADRTG